MIHPRGMVSVDHFHVTKKGPAHHMFSALPQPEDLPKLFPLDCMQPSFLQTQANLSEADLSEAFFASWLSHLYP